MNRTVRYQTAVNILIVLIVLLPSTLFSQESSSTSADMQWNDLKEAQTEAREHGKKVLIYSRAEWCHYCKKMEDEVFPRQEIRNMMKKYFYPVMIDIDSDARITFNGETMTENGFAREFQVSATPTLFFVDEKGEMLGRQPGYIPPEIFKKLLAYIGTEAYSEMKFKEYLEKEQ
ncbi:MAG: thioredoxin fold domain-containing protein [Balneolaceae bacterium]|nr:thioredoxin fold domain-containing protein [Balneolaceae bacterium]